MTLDDSKSNWDGSRDRKSKSQSQAESLQAQIEDLRTELSELRQREKWSRLVLSSLPHRVFIKDTESQFLYVNQAMADELGTTPEELIGKTDFEFSPKEQAEKYRADDRRVMQTRQPLTQVEPHPASGKETYIEVSKSPIIDDDGSVIGQMGLFTDVTKRVLAEEALQRRNAELRQAYAELKDAEAQLIHSEKMAAIGQIVAGLAHEINNPAAYVLNNLVILERDLKDVTEYLDECRALERLAQSFAPEQAQRISQLRQERNLDEIFGDIEDLIQTAQEGMKRICDLVNSLRSYSRVDTRSDFAVGDLNEGVKAAMVLLKPIVNKNMTIDLQLGTLPEVECNMGQINQVIMNILANAIQVIDMDGTVRVITKRFEDNKRDGVLIRIKDDGPGIPAKVRSRIFDPFFSTKEVGKGTGLGLSISRRIIESHGGRIWFQSQEGEGTEFQFWIPIKQNYEL